jgi:hypothetical protein
MGAKPKASQKATPEPNDGESGLWMDSALIARLHQQPTTTFHAAIAPTGTAHILRFADLALGTVKPEKFKAEKVSKTRTRK